MILHWCDLDEKLRTSISGFRSEFEKRKIKLNVWVVWYGSGTEIQDWLKKIKERVVLKEEVSHFVEVTSGVQQG